MKRRRTYRAVAGFTLVELLVAGALLILMLTMLVAVLSSVTNLSSRASARMDVMRLGREVFDLMQKDITQAASMPPSRGTGNGMQFLVNPAWLPANTYNPTAFFWQAPVARDRSAGDLAVVGYFVQRIGTNQSQLRRVFVEPSNTNDYHVYSTNATDNWITPALITEFSGSTDAPTATNLDPGWVANGVMGLWVRCLDANGNVITETGDGTPPPTDWTFNSWEGFRSGSGADAMVRTGINALPAYVDVGIVCVAARDLDRVDEVPDVPAGSPADFHADMQAYVNLFLTNNPRVETAVALTRRIPLAGGTP